VAFNLLGALIVLALSTGLNLLLRPRIKRPKGPTIEFPQADEGVPIPIGYGTFAVAPNIVYWKAGDQISFTNGTTGYTANMVGTLCLGPMDELVDIIVGGKSVSFEPVTLAQGGEVGDAQVIVPNLPYDRTGLAESADEPTTFIITAAAMFGGNTQEGGIRGTIRFYWGGLEQAADQVTTEYMQEQGLTGGTGRPGVCYVVFGPSDNGDAFYWGTNPTPKDVTFILRHNPETLEVGYPTRDANAAEILYDLQHNNLRGLGLHPSLTDEDSYAAVAETLVDEQLGISCCFSTQDEVEDMIEDVLKHIMGVIRIGPVTGQYDLKLARLDYTPSTLTRITTSLRGAVHANARNLKLSRPNYRETSNDITITYRRFETGLRGSVTGQVLTANFQYNVLGYKNLDTGAKNITAVTLYDDGVEIEAGFTFNPATGIVTIGTVSDVAEGSTITIDYTAGPVFSGYKEATSRWQDLASIQQSGELRSVTFDYPFFTSDLVAAQHVAKLGQQLSRSLYSAQWEMDRHGYNLAPGDVVRLNHEPLDADGNPFALVDDEPFRITEIDYGTLEDGTITVSAIEDVFAQDAVAILPAPPSTGGGATLVAPDIAIGQAATSAIRVCLYPGDQNFAIEIHRATDAIGTGETTLDDDLAGTTTHYDDAQTPPDVRYYRARLVPTSSQIGYSAGAWTAWTEMTAAAGTPGACTCTIPEITDVEALDDGVNASLTLTISDVQARIVSVEFQTQSGFGVLSAWVEDSAVPYTVSVSRPVGQRAVINYRITYLNCAGEEVSDLTDSYTFPLPAAVTDDVIVGADDVVVGALRVVATR
jgi:hypothetical protein